MRRMLRKHRPSLVIVDPIQAFIGPNVDFYKANQVRPILSGLGSLAEEFSCSFLIIAHLGKSGERSGFNKILGTVDFGAACRSVMLTAREPSDPSVRYLCLDRSTSHEDKLAIKYAIEGCELKMDDVTSETARIGWGEVIREAYDEIVGRKPQQATKTQEVSDMLLSELSSRDEVPQRELEEKAGSRSTLMRAKKLLEDEGYSIRSRKDGLTSGWVWSIET